MSLQNRKAVPLGMVEPFQGETVIVTYTKYIHDTLPFPPLVAKF
jgi:hypothetical protein